MTSLCICADYSIELEEKEGSFYDPENKLPRRTDGRKFRYIHFGCPCHCGQSYRRKPSEEVGINQANSIPEGNIYLRVVGGKPQ